MLLILRPARLRAERGSVDLLSGTVCFPLWHMDMSIVGWLPTTPLEKCLYERGHHPCNFCSPTDGGQVVELNESPPVSARAAMLEPLLLEVALPPLPPSSAGVTFLLVLISLVL